MLKSINHTTVPVLVVNGVFIGGSEELINILNTRQIRPILNQTKTRPKMQQIVLENEITIMDEESDDELYYDDVENNLEDSKALYAERYAYDSSEERESDDDSSIDNNELDLGTLFKNMNIEAKTIITDNTVAEKTSRDELDKEPTQIVLFDDSTVFQFYSKSKDGPSPDEKSKTKPLPGEGQGERIAEGEIGTYKILEQNPQWRRMLSNFWGASFNLDDRVWASVEHYYQGSKFKKNNLGFYHTFSLTYGTTATDLSTNPLMAKIAGGKSGKYVTKVPNAKSITTELRDSSIKVDEDFFEGRGAKEMEKAMYAKFSQNDTLKKVLLDTKRAKLTHFSRGNKPVVFYDLMRVRERLRKENEYK